MLLIISPLKHLADINQPLQRGLTAAEMIFQLIDQPIEEEDFSQSKFKRFYKAKGEIQFENLSFSYDQEEGRKDALRNVNLDIKSGEVIAFVGTSGGGKSTLVNLLPRFFKPKAGRILLDQVPIEEILLADLRKQIAFVSQDVILFNDTIAANVAYGSSSEGIDRGRVIEALEAANLTGLLTELPNGIDTLIGDNGNRLSGGQRQRLAIARALLKAMRIEVAETRVAVGRAAEEIVEIGSLYRVIVVTDEGRSRVQRLMRGSTATEVVRKARTSVLDVR